VRIGAGAVASPRDPPPLSELDRPVHGLRLGYVWLVGVDLLRAELPDLADDPRLTARLDAARQPLRVVLDATLRTPPDARLVSREPGGALIVAAAGAAPDGRRRRPGRFRCQFLRGVSRPGLHHDPGIPPPSPFRE